MTAAPAAARPSFLVRAGTFFFRRRDLVSPVVLVTLLALTRPVFPLGSATADRALDALGIGLSALGQALRIAVIGYAYIVRGGKNKRVHADDLVTGGLFATSRNPLYVGNLMIYGGLLVVWNSPWMYALGVPFYLFLYRSIVAAEERFLAEKFGAAYARYCAEVPRWIPDLRRLRAGLEGMRFNARRVILKEYGTIAAWTLAACLLVLLEPVRVVGGSPDALRPGPPAAAMAGIAVLWGVARWLKRSRRLRA